MLYAKCFNEEPQETIMNNREGIFDCIIGTESCALQIRMIIETIALLSLLVHKDINPSEINKLKKEFHAGDIIKTLSKINENFFPIPINQHTDTKNENTTIKHTFDVDGAISQKELIKAYGRCGDILHMGGFERIEDKTVFNIDVKFIQDTINGIVNLLNHHRILLKKENKYIRCILASRQNGTNVSVRIIDGDVWSESPNEKIFL